MDPQPPVEEVEAFEPPFTRLAHIYVNDDEVLQPTSVAEQLIGQGSLVLVGRTITLLDLELIFAYLNTAGYGYIKATCVGEHGPQVYLACYERAWPPEGDDHEGDTYSDISKARQRAMFDRMVRELNCVEVATAIGVLGAVVRQHEDYRMGWLANLAMSFRDEGMDHYAAQRGAARFMRQLFHVDVTKDEHFQHEPVNQPATTAEVAAAVATASEVTTDASVTADEEVTVASDDVSEAPHRNL